MPRIDMSGASTKSWTYQGTDKERRGPTTNVPPPTTKTRAFIIRRRYGMSVVAPYNADFVSQLKMVIPNTGRSWEPESKSWFVRKEYMALFEPLIMGYYNEVEWLYDEETKPAATIPPPPRPAQPQHLPPTEPNMRLYHADAATLEVWPTASLEVVRAAYRAKAKRLHPDVSGRDTTAEMKQLNAAMAAWESRHGAKK